MSSLPPRAARMLLDRKCEVLDGMWKGAAVHSPRRSSNRGLRGWLLSRKQGGRGEKRAHTPPLSGAQHSHDAATRVSVREAMKRSAVCVCVCARGLRDSPSFRWLRAVTDTPRLPTRCRQ